MLGAIRLSFSHNVHEDDTMDSGNLYIITVKQYGKV